MTQVFTALVTGATAGIGRATSVQLALDAIGRGARPRIVVAGSKPSPELQSLLSELEAVGAQALGVTADLADAEACERLARDATEFCGGQLDALVSNAGAGKGGALAGLPVAEWDRLFNLDCRATWLVARGCHEALRNAKGSVVAVASMAGLYPHAGSGAYSSAKAALIMLCRQLAQEWAPEGIRVNTVSPGMVRTRQTEAVYQNEDVASIRRSLVPLENRIGTPEDIATVISFLASPGAAYVTGSDLRADGGFCDSLLAKLPGLPRRA